MRARFKISRPKVVAYIVVLLGSVVGTYAVTWESYMLGVLGSCLVSFGSALYASTYGYQRGLQEAVDIVERKR